MAYDNFKIALFCGGTGTRLWPMSTGVKPKQFQPLIEGQSTFQIMVGSLKKVFPVEDIFPVTPRQYIGWIVEQAPDVPLENIIIEPERRDTLGAVGFATIFLAKKFDDPVMVSIWSDHLIGDPEGFGKALKTAAKIVARDNKVVRVGVRPTYPSTGLGYLQVGEMIEKVDSMAVFKYVRHIEKPELKVAKTFVESWEYLWHIGYNLWRASQMLKFFQEYSKEAFKILQSISQDKDIRSGSDKTLELYQKIEKTSIDYGIFENLPAEEQVVLSADLGWSDVGMWDVLKNELLKSDRENVTQGDVVTLDVRDSLIYNQNEGKVVAVVGLKNVIVVDTPDATLVIPDDRSQDVKKIMDEVRRE